MWFFYFSHSYSYYLKFYFKGNISFQLLFIYSITYLYHYGFGDLYFTVELYHSTIIAFAVPAVSTLAIGKSFRLAQVFFCDAHILFIHLLSTLLLSGASLVAHMVKNPPAVQEIRVRSLGQEDPLEKGMATHSTILAWRIPWTEELGEILSMGSQTQLSD